MLESQRIRVLAEQISQLKEENRQLKAQLYGDFNVPWEWKLSPSQLNVFKCLVSQPEVSYETAERAIWGNKPLPENYKNTMRVQVRLLRLKLKPHGYEVRNRSGFGYFIPKQQRDELKERFRSND